MEPDQKVSGNLMQIPDIDKRTKEDIIKYIEKVSRDYTPEWRFDREKPDIGTALALVYADMFHKSIGLYNQLLQKNCIAFFNSIQAKLLAAQPSEGFVTFSMVSTEVEGVEVTAKTAVSADGPEGEIRFETLDDLYVTPARIDDIYQTSDYRDYIAHIYQYNPDLEEQPEISLFDYDKVNLQEHELYFNHEDAFYIKNEVWIELAFYVKEDILVSADIIKSFLNQNNAVFEYYAQERYQQFEAIEYVEGKIRLYKGKQNPPFEKSVVGEIESYWIRCRILNVVPFLRMSFERMEISEAGQNILPDLINGNGIDCNILECVPFGEKFSSFNEVYFASQEALGKRGSEVVLDFDLDYARIPITDELTDETEWDWIMKRSDFKVDLDYDITIDEVIWEYFNGNGWSRLFTDNQYQDMFSADHGILGLHKRMHFICPSDLVQVLVNSCDSNFIRCRIIKINNLYKMKGYYITPILSNVSFSYSYEEHPFRPENIYQKNNLEIKIMDEKRPFLQTDLNKAAIYLGFETAPKDGPIKMLFSLKDDMTGGHGVFKWEYYAGNKFKELNMIDETNNISKTGLVTMMGGSDFTKKKLFGAERYWIRIVDDNNFYGQKENRRIRPLLKGIYMNSVRIKNVDLRETEYFRMENYKPNKSFYLMNTNETEIEVWVDEITETGNEISESFDEDKKIEKTYDESGMLTEVWHLWTEAEDFANSDAGSRHYITDRNAGTISFGNGTHGRIPPTSKKENIRVRYGCGGGKHTNLLPGSISRMGQTIGFINEVRNTESITGGCDRESVEDAIARNAAELRHGNRAISARDLEQMVKASARSIWKATCFTGYDETGMPMPGAITLVVLQKEFEKGHNSFSRMKEEIYEKMRTKVPGNLITHKCFFIAEPLFVEICIRADMIVKNFNSVFKVREESQRRIEEFLNPLTGNTVGEGWEIGSFPTLLQIQNELQNVEDVHFVKNVYMTAFISTENGKSEIDIDKIRKNKFILPVNGVHEIMIRVE